MTVTSSPTTAAQQLASLRHCQPAFREDSRKQAFRCPFPCLCSAAVMSPQLPLPESSTSSSRRSLSRGETLKRFTTFFGNTRSSVTLLRCVSLRQHQSASCRTEGRPACAKKVTQATGAKHVRRIHTVPFSTVYAHFMLNVAACELLYWPAQQCAPHHARTEDAVPGLMLAPIVAPAGRDHFVELPAPRRQKISPLLFRSVRS